MGSRSCIHLYSTLWIGCSTPDQKYPEALKKMPTLSCYHLLSLHLFCHHPILCICYLDNLWSLLGSPAARGDSRVAMLLQSKICAGPVFLSSCRSRTMLMRHGVSHNPTQTPLWYHSPCHYCYYPVVQWPRTAGSPPGANSFSKALCHSLLSGLWLMTMRPNSKRMPKALPRLCPGLEMNHASGNFGPERCTIDPRCLSRLLSLVHRRNQRNRRIQGGLLGEDIAALDDVLPTVSLLLSLDSCRNASRNQWLSGETEQNGNKTRKCPKCPKCPALLVMSDTRMLRLYCIDATVHPRSTPVRFGVVDVWAEGLPSEGGVPVFHFFGGLTS